MPFACAKPRQQILTGNEARANLYQLMDQAAEPHQPNVIAGNRSNAALVSAKSWEAIQETFFLLSIPGMRESIKAGLEMWLAHIHVVQISSIDWCTKY